MAARGTSLATNVGQELSPSAAGEVSKSIPIHGVNIELEEFAAG